VLLKEPRRSFGALEEAVLLLTNRSMQLLGALEGAAYLAAACYIFFGISILCDKHLCPALDQICERYKIPTTIAAATLISFGSSAPEIIISTLGAASNNTLLSIPAVLVSALIAFGAIPPLVVLATGPITLRVLDVMRDAIAYALVLGLFIATNEGGTIGILPSSALIAAYLIYLAVIYVTSETSEQLDSDQEEATTLREPLLNTKNGDDVARSISGKSGLLVRAANLEKKVFEGNTSSPDVGLMMRVQRVEQAVKQPRVGCLVKRVSLLEEKLLPERQGVDIGDEDSRTTDKEDDEDDEEESKLTKVLSWPWVKMLTPTIPSENAIGGFSLSLAWLCFLSYGAMVLAEYVVDKWEIGMATAGITLLAWGGQMPDTIAAIELAKSGKPDEAICQAIASQVINISIGLGLPLLAYDIITGKPTVTQKHVTVVFIAAFVLGSIVVYILALLPSGVSCRKWLKDGRGTISNFRAFVIGFAYLGLYGGSIAVAEIRKHSPD